MKSTIFSLFLAGAAATVLSLQTVRADDLSAGGQTAPSTGASDGTAPAQGQGQRWQRFKEAMAQLDLTEAQKALIKQIRATVTDKKERRQQVLAVLTPDQKAKLRQLILAHRDGAQAGGAQTTSTGDDTPLAPDAN